MKNPGLKKCIVLSLTVLSAGFSASVAHAGFFDYFTQQGWVDKANKEAVKRERDFADRVAAENAEAAQSEIAPSGQASRPTRAELLEQIDEIVQADEGFAKIGEERMFPKGATPVQVVQKIIDVYRSSGALYRTHQLELLEAILNGSQHYPSQAELEALLGEGEVPPGSASPDVVVSRAAKAVKGAFEGGTGVGSEALPDPAKLDVLK